MIVLSLLKILVKLMWNNVNWDLAPFFVFFAIQGSVYAARGSIENFTSAVCISAAMTAK